MILAQPDPSLADGVLIPAVVSLLVTLLAAAAGWWWQLRQKRRDEQGRLYADALAAVQAYKEFPYVVRRRDHTAPATERVRISEAVRAVQQDIAFHTAWMDIHDGDVAAAYRRLVAETRRIAGGLMHEAWKTAPVTDDADMNITDVGPRLAALDESHQEYLTAVRKSLRSGILRR